jgi:hypothetical protein
VSFLVRLGHFPRLALADAALALRRPSRSATCRYVNQAGKGDTTSDMSGRMPAVLGSDKRAPDAVRFHSPATK